jgi:uncharacterized protein YjiS (DUF1127 family)
MATISQSAGRPLNSLSWKGFVSALVAMFYALFDLLERRSAMKTLSELDDRALRDIGITRSQIEDAVGGQLTQDIMRHF